MRSVRLSSSVVALSVVLAFACGGPPAPVAPRAPGPARARSFAQDELHLGDVRELPPTGEGTIGPFAWGRDPIEARAGGSGVVSLTGAPGYAAPGAVCKKDGSIVFSSVHDGDIELYRMNADGEHRRRLTRFAGYDGGASFNQDCSKIVWHASRPRPGKETQQYEALLKQGVARPDKLEVWVANADGSEPVQITTLDAVSFAPAFFPGAERVVFGSSYGDPSGREFDLWAVNVDGTGLERITFAPGFDGFPRFSPDATSLVFSSNRAIQPGGRDTRVFRARWIAGKLLTIPSAADRLARDCAWLAAPEREGRGVGTKGLADAALYVEKRFLELGLEPAGKTMRQPFDIVVSLGGTANLVVGGKDIADPMPLGFSASSAPVEAPLVLAGYGLQEAGRDDYMGVDVKGKIAVVRRFLPDEASFDDAAPGVRRGDLRRKALLAREKGALGIVIVDRPARPAKAPPGWKMPDEARAPILASDGRGDVGMAAVVAPRAGFASVLARLERKEHVRARLGVSLVARTSQAYNVVAKWAAQVPDEQKQRGAVVLGAHYDHLGAGGYGSLEPESRAVHPGADDNASGTAGLLELARAIAGGKLKLRRDVIFAAFAGQEHGALGSAAFLRDPLPGAGPSDLYAMIDLDMVGRLRGNLLDVVGLDTADEWPAMLELACAGARVQCLHVGAGGCASSGDAPFHRAGVPVLHLFSGVHHDLHRPSDTADKINAAGLVEVAKVVVATVQALCLRESKLTFRQPASGPAPEPDGRNLAAPPRGEGMITP